MTVDQQEGVRDGKEMSGDEEEPTQQKGGKEVDSSMWNRRDEPEEGGGKGRSRGEWCDTRNEKQDIIQRARWIPCTGCVMHQSYEVDLYERRGVAYATRGNKRKRRRMLGHDVGAAGVRGQGPRSRARDRAAAGTRREWLGIF